MLRNVTPDPIRVALLEDVPLFRQIMEQTLEQAPGMELCASASTCHQALTVIPPSGADIAVLDLFLPDGSGFDVGVSLRRELPEVRIVILSEHVQPRVLASLSESERQSWSYLLKTKVSSGEELLGSIRSAMRYSVVDKGVTERSVDPATLRLELLSEQQREILTFVAAGLSNGAIAERMHLSAKSVEYHLTQIYSLLHVSTDREANPRVQAAALFLKPDAN
jgi:DNA-binding NarL/FixJ family response regulator